MRCAGKISFRKSHFRKSHFKKLTYNLTQRLILPHPLICRWKRQRGESETKMRGDTEEARRRKEIKTKGDTVSGAVCRLKRGIKVSGEIKTQERCQEEGSTERERERQRERERERERGREGGRERPSWRRINAVCPRREPVPHMIWGSSPSSRTIPMKSPDCNSSTLICASAG
jgi:hypothetical protein